jgi:hypothetical protein
MSGIRNFPILSLVRNLQSIGWSWNSWMCVVAGLGLKGPVIFTL